MIRVGIVEDHPEEREQMREYISRYSRERGLSVQTDLYADGDEIAEKFRKGYDILFLDIELPLLSGMDAAELIRREDPDVTIIFTTNNPSYAIRGYQVSALDYLLKPLSYDAFSSVMERALRHRKSRKEHYISIRVKNGTLRLDISKILYIDVLDHYLCYHTDEGGITTKGSMKDAAKELQDEAFFQCNKAFLVNLARVDGVTGSDLIIGGERIPVSRARKKALLDAMNDYMMSR